MTTPLGDAVNYTVKKIHENTALWIENDSLKKEIESLKNRISKLEKTIDKMDQWNAMDRDSLGLYRKGL